MNRCRKEENSWTGKEERAIVPLQRSVRKVLKGVILMDDVLASKILNEMEEDDVEGIDTLDVCRMSCAV